MHEIKYDGYRLLAHIEGGQVRLISRNGKDWSERFGAVVRDLAVMPVRNALLDGEVAVVRPDGRTRFQDLQNILSGESRGGALRYFAFDLLFADGVDYREQPLVERKRRLSALVDALPETSVVRFADHVEGNGPAFFAQASKYGLEGIISKRRDSHYVPGRGRDWLKVKCNRVDEFVVGGFTDPGGSRPGFGALLLGAHDPATGALLFTGRVGTGFSDAQLVSVRKQLDALVREASPFADGPSGRDARGMHWVEPKLVAQVAYVDLTNERFLRHPSFVGFREDRDPSGVMLPGEERAMGAARVPANAPPAMPSTPRARGVPRRPKKAATRVAGIAVTNPDKVLYPESGIRKLELLEYYEAVGTAMLAWAADRPITLVRCPDGIANCFYQKHIEGAVPPGVHSVRVRDGGEEADYPWVDSTGGLVALAQLGVLEMHTWGSRRYDLERPDRFTMDLDPDVDLPWIRVIEAVLEVRRFLSELGLVSFLKTTGGKGLHVVVPIRPHREWDEVKEFTRGVASTMAGASPSRYTTVVTRERRKGRILLDYLRNGRGATAVEAFSTRARPGAPVAVPIRWEELAEGVRGDSFNLRSVPARLADLNADPWAGYADLDQDLTDAMMREVGAVTG